MGFFKACGAPLHPRHVNSEAPFAERHTKHQSLRSVPSKHCVASSAETLCRRCVVSRTKFARSSMETNPRGNDVGDENVQQQIPQRLPQEMHEMYRNIVACLLHPTDDTLVKGFRPFLLDNFKLLYETFGMDESHHREIIGDRQFSNGDLLAQLRQTVDTINMNCHPSLNPYSWKDTTKYAEWKQSITQTLTQKARNILDAKRSGVLHIQVVSASNVRPTDRSGPTLECTSSDPFITIGLMNTNEPILSTKVVKENLHPIWEEEFDIEIKNPNQIMQFILRDEGPVRNEEIGSIYIPVQLLKDSLAHDVEFEFISPCRQDMINWDNLKSIEELQQAYEMLLVNPNEQKAGGKAFFNKFLSALKLQGEIKKGGRVRLILHYCYRNTNETPKTFRIYDDVHKFASIMVDRFMIAARHRTVQKGAIDLPGDYEAILREFILRYGAEESLFELLIFEWIANDLLERTNGEKLNADGSPKRCSFNDVDLVCNSKKAGPTFYDRLLRALSVVTQNMKKYTFRQVELIRNLSDSLQKRISHMLANYYEALILRDRISTKILAHLTRTLEDLQAAPFTQEECAMLVKKGIEARMQRWFAECVNHSINYPKIKALCELVLCELGHATGEFHAKFEEILPGFNLKQMVVDSIYEDFSGKITDYCTADNIDEAALVVKVCSKCRDINAIIQKDDSIRVKSLLQVENLFRFYKSRLADNYSKNVAGIVDRSFKQDQFNSTNKSMVSQSAVDFLHLSDSVRVSLQEMCSDVNDLLEFLKSFSNGCLIYFGLLSTIFEAPRPVEQQNLEQIGRASSSVGTLVNIGGKVIWKATTPLRCIANAAVSTVKSLAKAPDQDTAIQDVQCEFPDEKMCLAINNAQRVKKEWEEYIRRVVEYGSKSDHQADFAEIIQTEMKVYEDRLDESFSNLRSLFLNKFEMKVRVTFRTFFEAPLSSNLKAEERIQPLLGELKHIKYYESIVEKFQEILLGGLWKILTKIVEECLLSAPEAIQKIQTATEALLLSDALNILMGEFHDDAKGLPEEFIKKVSKRASDLIGLFKLGSQGLINTYYELERESELRLKQSDVLVIFEKTQKREIYDKFRAQIAGQPQIQSENRSEFGVKESEILLERFDCRDGQKHGKIHFYSNSLLFTTKDMKSHFRFEYSTIKYYSKGKSSSSDTISIFLDAIVDQCTIKKEISGFANSKAVLDAYDCLDGQMQAVDTSRSRSESYNQSEFIKSFSLNLFGSKLSEGNSKQMRDFFSVAYDCPFLAGFQCIVNKVQMALFLYDSKLCFYGETLTSKIKIIIPKENITLVRGSYTQKLIRVILTSNIPECSKPYEISASFETDILYRLLVFWKPECNDPEAQTFCSEDAQENAAITRDISLCSDERVIISSTTQENWELGVLYLSTNYLIWKSYSKKPHYFKINFIGRFRRTGSTLEIASIDEKYAEFKYLKNISMFEILLKRRISIIKELHGDLSLGVTNTWDPQRGAEVEYVDNIRYRGLFDIHDDDTLIYKERCWVMPNSGTLWVGTKRLCFQPDFSLLPSNIIIPLDEMIGIRKEVSAQLIDSIVIKTQEKEYRFSKLRDKDRLFDLILESAPKDISNYQTHDPFTTKKVQKWFSLGRDDTYLEYFSCICSENAHSGGIYLTKNHICFKSFIDIQSSFIKIPIEQISTIEEVSILRLFPTGLKVYLKNGKTHTFHGFVNRAYALDRLANQASECGVSFLQGKPKGA